MILKRKEGEQTEDYYKQLYNKSLNVLTQQEKEIERLNVLVKKINLELLKEMEEHMKLQTNCH